jgi:ABC-2 type transport system ATP-binding protein
MERDNSALIEARNLGKTFRTPQGDVVAVAGLNFTIQAGEIVGLMGPNGAGKSTTMRLLAGALTPTTGEAVLSGHPLATHRRRAQKSVGYLAEVPPEENDLTPLDLLQMNAGIQAVPNPAGAVETVAKLTRCREYAGRPMAELSKGQKQRVHLACALVHNPPILLLDEPTDGLDPNQKHELRHMLKQLANPRGTPTRAIVVSTHMLEEAQALCTRVLIIHRGQLLLDTTPDELAHHGKGDMELAFRVLTTNRAGA